MFPTLYKKELREQSRTHRLLIILAWFSLLGLVSPLIARYTPVLLRSIPDLPAGLAELIPNPTVSDAILQYVKNFSQIGLLLVIVMAMGLIAQEKERGTAAMLFTKPVRRAAFVLGKWLASLTGLVAGIILAAAGCFLYTLILFEPLPVGQFLALNVLLAVYLGFYLTLALTGSALARSQPAAAGFAFGLAALSFVLGALPRVGDYMPGRLLAWGEALLLGEPFSAWPALIVTVGLAGLALLVACLYMERQEV